MVRRRAAADRGRRRGDHPTSASRRTLAEHVPDASERERIGPALLCLLGVDEGSAGGRETLFPAWRLLFERIAEKGTTVLVFEDLQWADSGLLDFIDHLLDWSRGLPILVVTPGPARAVRPAARLGRQPAPPDRHGARALDR